MFIPDWSLPWVIIVAGIFLSIIINKAFKEGIKYGRDKKDQI